MHIIIRKKILLFIACFLLAHLTSAQGSQLIKVDGVYYVESNGVPYLADTSVVTVKLRDGLEKSGIALNIIRTRKLGFIDVAVPTNTNLEEFVTMLKKSKDFEYVGYNSFGRACFKPNDSQVDEQWHLPFIKAFDAWDLTTGSASVKVAVLDSNLEWWHPDIGYGNDGYKNVDEELGKDYYNGEVDDHGTTVSGVLGAKSNNGIGVAGISGGDGTSPGVTIIPMRVGSFMGYPSYHISAAINDAVDRGARVINMSFSVAQNDDIDASIANAAQNNVILVASSGNIKDATSGVRYPGRHPEVIAVGAVGKDTTRGDSEYGAQLDVVAPGVDILTTTSNDSYVSKTGTSYAAPMVSGIAALMLSVNPNLTRQEVRNIIESTAQKVCRWRYPYDETPGPNGGWHEEVGYGMVDAYAAVLAAIPCKNGLPVESGRITQNTTWNTPRHAMKIIVQSGATLTTTSRVECGIIGSFTIESGGKLVIDGGTFTNACEGEMWQGITVLSGGSVEIKNNGKIEHAICGIVVKGGGMVNATNARFVNNTEHVNFEPLASGQSVLSGTFIQTNFTMDNSYLGNLISFDAQIKMESSNKILVTGGFAAPVSFNIDNGIVVINSATTWAGNIQLLSVPVAIQSGGTLTNTGTISSNGQTSVTVHPGGKIIINGGTFKNVPAGPMWQGITVMGDLTKPLNQNEQGYVKIINNGKIEHAICGIVVKGGGMVNVTNAHFVNNTGHVNFELLASGQSCLSGTFTQTNFTMNNDYWCDPVSFVARIRMENSSKILVTGSFASPMSFDIDNGTVAINSAITWAGNIQLLSVPFAVQARGILTNTGTISSNEHTTITVHPGGKIVMDGGTFKNATSRLWKGITVLGNPRQPMREGAQGVIDLRNGGKIENAKCGITVKGGGMVYATEAHFINNTVGV
ncbi:MAG: S8 family serine peptidase, partial [Bacteroidetes bacterium]|nr:S8 family serine peptidase [Bacteroidota bacterium]